MKIRNFVVGAVETPIDIHGERSVAAAVVIIIVVILAGAAVILRISGCVGARN